MLLGIILSNRMSFQDAISRYKKRLAFRETLRLATDNTRRVPVLTLHLHLTRHLHTSNDHIHHASRQFLEFGSP
jgi:hypothetical protein